MKLASGLLASVIVLSLSGFAWSYMGPEWGMRSRWGSPMGPYSMGRMMDYCMDAMNRWWTPERSSFNYRGLSLSKSDAERLLGDHLTSLRNPNLKIGKFTEESDRFIAELTTKDGSLVDKLIIGKYSGRIRSTYR